MINVNHMMAGMLSETMMATGLRPAHQPEEGDGTTNWDNDVYHILKDARGEERRTKLRALFNRMATRAPASAYYQQVASVTVSSLSNTYANMGMFCSTIDLNPSDLHTLLISSGLVQALSELLLKPLPEESSVMNPQPGVREDATWPALDFYALCLVVYMCEVEPDQERGEPRSNSRYLPNGPPAAAEAAARQACVALLQAGALAKIARLAGGARTYLETARALYALRVMTASSAEVCAALAVEPRALGQLCTVATPGWSLRLWEATETSGLPPYHAPVLAHQWQTRAPPSP